MGTVPVYHWVASNGEPIGVGTSREFDHWSSAGVLPSGAKLGAVVCEEPASEDERRAKAWAAS